MINKIIITKRFFNVILFSLLSSKAYAINVMPILIHPVVVPVGDFIITEGSDPIITESGGDNLIIE